MQQEPSGAGPQVVELGSAADPFTQPATDALAGQQQVVEGTNRAEGEPDQPTTAAPSTPASQPAPDLTALHEAIQSQVSQAQSGWDRRNHLLEEQNAKLTQQISEIGQRVKEAERHGKEEGLSGEESALLRAGWDVEDAKSLLNTQREAVDEYRTAVIAHDAMVRFGSLGLTEEMLEGKGADEIDGMMAAYGTIAKQPTPAAAKATSDLGGAPPAPEPFKLGSEQGVDAMATNVKNLFGQPGNIR